MLIIRIIAIILVSVWLAVYVAGVVFFFISVDDRADTGGLLKGVDEALRKRREEVDGDTRFSQACFFSLAGLLWPLGSLYVIFRPVLKRLFK